MKGLTRFFLVTNIFLSASSIWCASSPIIETDTNGNGLLVWETSIENGKNIMGNVLYNDTWSGPSTLATGEITSKPIVATIANGSDLQGIVVWSQNDSEYQRLCAKMLVSGENEWSKTNFISTEGENLASSKFDVKLNQDGTVRVTWSAYLNNDQTKRIIRSSTSIIGMANKWTEPETVSSL